MYPVSVGAAVRKSSFQRSSCMVKESQCATQKHCSFICRAHADTRWPHRRPNLTRLPPQPARAGVAKNSPVVSLWAFFVKVGALLREGEV